MSNRTIVPAEPGIVATTIFVSRYGEPTVEMSSHRVIAWEVSDDDTMPILALRGRGFDPFGEDIEMTLIPCADGVGFDEVTGGYWSSPQDAAVGALKRMRLRKQQDQEQHT